MKSMLRTVVHGDKRYSSLAFICPGCALQDGTGLHMLPVNTDVTSPAWTWDGNLEIPTISPSIKTESGNPDKHFVCHSFLKAGIFDYLSDCTHALSGKQVPIPDLPDWFTNEEKENTMGEEQNQGQVAQEASSQGVETTQFPPQGQPAQQQPAQQQAPGSPQSAADPSGQAAPENQPAQDAGVEGNTSGNVNTVDQEQAARDVVENRQQDDNAGVTGNTSGTTQQGQQAQDASNVPNQTQNQPAEPDATGGEASPS